MKPALFLLTLLLVPCLISCDQRQAAATSQPATTGSISVTFSPKGGCTDAVVSQIGQAQSSIDVQAYSFTSAPIADALTYAQARGVKLRVVLDKSQRTEKYSSATFLFNHQVPVYIDSRHAIAHNKIMILDGRTILTGSFNFTKAAEESNAENLLVIQGQPDLVAQYQKNFQTHLAHSDAYKPQ